METTGWASNVVMFVRENERLVEVVLFLLAMGESIVLFSFFIPASVLFLAIGGIHAAAGGQILPLIVAGTAGAFLGDFISYYIGWRYRHDLQQRWPFNAHPEWLANARKFFDKWGIAGVVAAKFVGPMRPLVPTISGAVAMPSRAFVPASAVSSLVWSIVFLAPTFYGVNWFKG